MHFGTEMNASKGQRFGGSLADVVRSINLLTYLKVKVPYLTFMAGSVSYPTLRLYPFGPVRIPDVTVGHNSLLVVLTKHIRDKVHQFQVDMIQPDRQ